MRDFLHLVSLERRLVQISQRLNVPACLETELVHGDIRRHTAAAWASAAGANGWLAVLASSEHRVNAWDGLARARRGSGCWGC
jgi:hypothetical protein